MTASKVLLYGGACVVGALGLAVFLGAVGAELIFRWYEDRR